MARRSISEHFRGDPDPLGREELREDIEFETPVVPFEREISPFEARVVTSSLGLHKQIKKLPILHRFSSCCHFGKCFDFLLPPPKMYSIIDDDIEDCREDSDLPTRHNSRKFRRCTYSKRVDEILRHHEVRGSSRTLDSFYDKLEKLGEGAYGTVTKYKCKSAGHARPEEVAVKHIQWDVVWHGMSRDKKHEAELRHELKVLMLIDCPYLVRVREWFEHPRKGIYFVMELCRGGSLQDLLENICKESDRELRVQQNEQRLRKTFCQINYALAYLHGMEPPMVHRDMKPDNVLFKSATPLSTHNGPNHVAKLCDFGLASLDHEAGQCEEKWKKGTSLFMAPKQYVEKSGSITPAHDIWAVGIILSWMITALELGSLQHPMLEEDIGKDFRVRPNDLRRAYKELIKGTRQWNRGLFGDQQEVVADLADRILVVEERRCTAADILGHEWILFNNTLTDDVPLKQCILSNLQTYASLSLFERTVINAVAAKVDANHLSGESQVALSQLRYFFRHANTSHTGYLVAQEIVSSFDDLPDALSEEDLTPLFEAMNRSQSRKLYWTDWLAATIGRGILTNPEVKDLAFWSLDASHSGAITVSDLARMMGKEAAQDVMEEHAKHEITKVEFTEICDKIASKRMTIRVGGGVGSSVVEEEQLGRRISQRQSLSLRKSGELLD